MPLLKVFAAWRLAPRFDVFDVEPGELLRSAVARHFGVHPESLKLCDDAGRDLDPEAVVSTKSGADEVRVVGASTRPICHVLGFFRTSDPQSIRGRTEGESEDAVASVSAMGRLSSAERTLGTTLVDLGLGLDLDRFDPEELARGFRPLPPGYEVSPYRFFFAAAATISEQNLEDLDRLDEGVERLAALLADRLRIRNPDALDLRLYLFVSGDDRRWGEKRFSESVSEAGPGRALPGAAFPGAAYRGWRRLIVMPYLDEEDRLLQMAHLGRSLSVERLDESARLGVQKALAVFAPLYAGRKDIFDCQRQVTIRSMEERLRERAESLLLGRLVAWLTGDGEETASSGMADDLARRALEKAGLHRTLDGSDTLLGETVRRLWGERLERGREVRFGGPVRSLSRRNDGKLLAWLDGLSDGAGDPPLPKGDLDLLFRTVVIDAACRLRGAIEQMIEQDVFPSAGAPELPLGQFFAAMEALGRELRRFFEWSSSSFIGTFLEQRAGELEARIERAEADMIRLSDPLFSKVGRWFGRQESIYSRLHDRLEQWEIDRVELHVVRRWSLEASKQESCAESEGLLDLADQLLARFAALAEEIAAARAQLDAENERRERVASLGALEVPIDGESHLLQQLARAVDELPVDEALARALREDCELRDLFHLSPDDLLVHLLDELLPAVRPAIGHLAEELGSSRWPQLLEAGLRELFVDAPLPASGRDGTPGSFDHKTCILAFVSPQMHRQVPDLEERLEQQVQVLPDILKPPPVHVVESSSAPGLVLIRSVQALTWEEVAP